MSVKIEMISALAMTVIFFIAGDAFAGAAPRNITTQSAQAWLSGLGRYAETEDADTVLNNPAGAAYMVDGIHIHLSTMAADNTWNIKNVDTGVEYETNSVGFIPGFAFTYKKDNWAVFQTIFFPGGKGSGDYDRHPMFDSIADSLGPNITAENQKFEFSGGKMALAIGGAYAINDTFSVGYSIQAVHSSSFVDAEATLISQDTGQEVGRIRLDQEYEGWGLGQSLCMLFNYDKFKLGLRFDPEVKIKEKADIKPGDVSKIPNGSEKHQDLPPILGTGASYQLTPKFKFGGGFVYYWQKGINGDDEPITEQWDNAWEIQGFVEYALTPEWELLAGVNYIYQGIPDESYTLADTSFANGWSFNAGAQWRPTPHWSFIMGLGHAFFPNKPKTEAEEMGLYERSAGKPVINLIAGIEYKR